MVKNLSWNTTGTFPFLYTYQAKLTYSHNSAIGQKHARTPRCLVLGHLFACGTHKEVWHYQDEECRKCKFIRVKTEKRAAEEKSEEKEVAATKAAAKAFAANYGEPSQTKKAGGGQGKRKTLRTSGYQEKLVPVAKTIKAFGASYGEPHKTKKAGGGQGKRKTFAMSGYNYN